AIARMKGLVDPGRSHQTHRIESQEGTHLIALSQLEIERVEVEIPAERGRIVEDGCVDCRNPDALESDSGQGKLHMGMVGCARMKSGPDRAHRKTRRIAEGKAHAWLPARLEIDERTSRRAVGAARSLPRIVSNCI